MLGLGVFLFWLLAQYLQGEKRCLKQQLINTSIFVNPPPTSKIVSTKEKRRQEKKKKPNINRSFTLTESL